MFKQRLNLKSRFSRLTPWLAVVALMVVTLIPAQFASAAQLTSRKVTISSSAASATGVTYTFSFVAPSATIVQSMQIDICTTALGACNPVTPTGVPAGLSTTGATANPQPVNLGDASGWTSSFGTNGRLRITKSGNATAPSGTSSLAVAGITNPSATNTTFFARITTYSDAAYTTAIDTGTVATSTANQITATAAVQETLTFCVYGAGTCASPTTNTVDLGILTTAAPNSGTSKFEVSTNASQGYIVTYFGATLTSGSFTITGFPSGGTTSAAGTEQFGINLRANTTPSVGTDVSGSAPIGTYTSPYGTANTYAYNPSTTTQIAQASGPVNLSTYTVSYVANVAPLTETGTYTTTLTYVCVPTY